ncbi:transcriptional regulator [Pseudomonas cichorii]|uniref:Helix-turn-helix domain-containing protein n=1 Tax=Pseudomonas serbiensis TaxID=3064350 RepID=A0ABT9CWI4_9PSED|nr:MULTISPECIES: helix-turn-helix domain-containing protein [Pseudomonas]MDO7928190.1 helix-turn-helix domain-containing protein [Pseudomonas sp. KFB-138]GFM82615.1 transcriptional regulator [Pseudomonas cichorii]GFM88870.1 transcriptional regulator [Pseudomonas cichorii]
MLDDTGTECCSPERLEQTRAVLDQIANKWSIMILTRLGDGPVRFNELQRLLGTVTQKSLTEALRRLERYRLISRQVISSSPVAVQYEVTDLGRTLEVPVSALVRWAEQHAAEMMQDQIENKST